MQELILSWLNHVPPLTFVLHPEQPTKTRGKFRLGRDPHTCDLVLPSATTDDCLVSRLHAEIYLDSHAQQFYLHNFKSEKLLLTLDGSPVSSEPVLLLKGSTLQLAHHRFQIQVKEEPKIKSDPPVLKPLLCPHCNTGYTYAEAAQMNDRCHKDGFLLYGHSIGIFLNR